MEGEIDHSKDAIERESKGKERVEESNRLSLAVRVSRTKGGVKKKGCFSEMALHLQCHITVNVALCSACQREGGRWLGLGLGLG